MKITLLGTGAADGWPNPFCDCASCADARNRGIQRRPTSALLDDVVLIDPGPSACHAASSLGRSLARVRDVLITHGHPDHLDPAFLLWRYWAERQQALPPIRIHGPRRAIDLCRPWVSPDADIFHEVAAGDSFETSTGFHVRVLPSAHAGAIPDDIAAETVLYDIATSTGRLLYATDTGPLPSEWFEEVRNADFDVVLLEETFGHLDGSPHGHLDFATFRSTIASLRDCGAVHHSTHIVPVHLGHHNPPQTQTADALREIGATMLPDLATIDSERSIPSRGVTTFLLGGARSGKSTAAEQIALSSADVVTYVATAAPRTDDPEWTRRIALHRDRRPDHWKLVETTAIADLMRTAEPNETLLIDCLTLWLTDVMYADYETGTKDPEPAIADLIDALATCRASVILVSNEVGMGVVPTSISGREFQDALGRLNQAVARACDQPYLVIAGSLLPLQPSQPGAPR